MAIPAGDPMHELGLTREIVDICLAHAAGRRVVAVTLEIGVLSGVVPEAVEFCFDACTHGTLVEGARLEIIRKPASGMCAACGAAVCPSSHYEPCPSCGSCGIVLAEGTEMRVKELEVE